MSCMESTEVRSDRGLRNDTPAASRFLRIRTLTFDVRLVQSISPMKDRPHSCTSNTISSRAGMETQNTSTQMIRYFVQSSTRTQY
jgi:hypothetical protein